FFVGGRSPPTKKPLFPAALAALLLSMAPFAHKTKRIQIPFHMALDAPHLRVNLKFRSPETKRILIFF
ncbi:MAG: hypothetical protein JXA33_10665, partial [Anaerolineae bacterium]|nr:hypothetical protein [Anaerolineae bacterium]